MFKILICILIAYLLGNISGAIIFGKILFNKDIRKYGSKNAGILTFLIDFFKAILACFFWIFITWGKWCLFIGYICCFRT